MTAIGAKRTLGLISVWGAPALGWRHVETVTGSMAVILAIMTAALLML
jgi:hypothetical protein